MIKLLAVVGLSISFIAVSVLVRDARAQTMANDRTTFVSEQGTTTTGNFVTIPESLVEALCSDHDGCELRLGSWSGGQLDVFKAGTIGLFYYNADNNSYYRIGEGTQPVFYNGRGDYGYILKADECVMANSNPNVKFQPDNDTDFYLGAEKPGNTNAAFQGCTLAIKD